MNDITEKKKDKGDPRQSQNGQKSSKEMALQEELDDAARCSDDGSDPVMISPSASPRPCTSPAVVDSDGEHFEDSIEQVEDDSKDTMKSKTKDFPSYPPSFVSVGLQRKASPWELESWVALSLTLDGRDKITKVLQYVTRFLGWWFLVAAGGTAATASYRKNQSIRFTTLYKVLSESRKAFRLGRSITEAHKIASMGLIGLLCWHLRQHLDRLEGVTSNKDEEKNSHPPRTVVRRASSNIGWGPMTLDEVADATNEKSSVSRSLSSMAYRKMYRPLLSRVYSTFASTATPSVEWWAASGSALKMVGLFGFWLGDNVNFLTSAGAFDNYTLSAEERLSRRKRWQTWASERANQAYFFGAVAGLVTNAYAYYRFQKDKLAQAQQEYQHVVQKHCGNENIEKEEQEYALRQLKKVKEKQFNLFLALLKSCVDVTVFSNNPGVDLHKKLRGRKNNEGLHCLCGLISASTVLYTNFPDARKPQGIERSSNKP